MHRVDRVTTPDLQGNVGAATLTKHVIAETGPEPRRTWPATPNFKAGNMNHKLIVVYDSFDSEDHARWYSQHLKTTDDHVAKIYVVQDESEDR